MKKMQITWHHYLRTKSLEDKMQENSFRDLGQDILLNQMEDIAWRMGQVALLAHLE